MGSTLTALVVLAAVSLSACVTYPNPGPSSPAYIVDGKTQAEFAQADAYCRDLAQQRTGPAPGEAAGEGPPDRLPDPERPFS